MPSDYTMTEYEYWYLLRDLFFEQLSFDWDRTTDEEHTHWTAELSREALEYDGRWHQIIDGSVPVYTYAAIETWLNVGMPEAEDYFGENAGTIVEQVMAGLYYWADSYCREFFDEWHEEFMEMKTTGKVAV